LCDEDSCGINIVLNGKVKNFRCNIHGRWFDEWLKIYLNVSISIGKVMLRLCHRVDSGWDSYMIMQFGVDKRLKRRLRTHGSQRSYIVGWLFLLW
jgi:hypothetical protein